MKLSFLSGVTKEKNEDENCDYEMVWDAEGSMHLVKKVLQAPVKRQSDKSQIERWVRPYNPPSVASHVRRKFWCSLLFF